MILCSANWKVHIGEVNMQAAYFMQLIIQGMWGRKPNLVKQSGRWAIYFLGEEDLKFGPKQVSSFSHSSKE